MSCLHPGKHPYALGFLALVVAFLSASQDIAINAYTTDVLLPEERGLGAAMTVGGYRIAMLVSGGVALIMADHVGWHQTYLIMAPKYIRERYKPMRANQAPPQMTPNKVASNPKPLLMVPTSVKEKCTPRNKKVVDKLPANTSPNL